MPDVTLIEVLEGARQTWSADPYLNGIVPSGRIYSFSAPERTVLPYVVLEPGDVSAYFGGTTYFSGTSYIKINSVTFTVYGLANSVDWKTLAQAMSDAFGWTATDPRVRWVIPNAVSVISAMPEVDKFERSGERIDGDEVMKYSSQYKVTIEANRG